MSTRVKRSFELDRNLPRLAGPRRGDELGTAPALEARPSNPTHDGGFPVKAWRGIVLSVTEGKWSPTTRLPEVDRHMPAGRILRERVRTQTSDN